MLLLLLVNTHAILVLVLASCGWVKTVLRVQELLLLLDLLLDNIIIVHTGPLWRYELTSLFWIKFLIIDSGSSQLLSFSKPLLNLLDHALEALKRLIQALSCISAIIVLGCGCLLLAAET